MALSNAERQARYRKRQQSRAALADLFSNTTIDELNALAAEFNIEPNEALARLIRFASEGRNPDLIHDQDFVRRFALLLTTSMANDPNATGYKI